MFERDSDRDIFKKFIEYIRFPFFKNFEKDLRVNFSFPITFIVGQNGSGKSSLLHALYGAPTGYSIEDFWFSTSLDPIEDEGKNRHCFIYGYLTPESKKIAEILKTRIRRENNPDYWEPSRPLKKYGMKEPEGYTPKEVTPKGDRWEVIAKDVYYMDFRYALSAYDKYYYAEFTNEARKRKKNIIRRISKKLSQAFRWQCNVFYYSRKIEEPQTLSKEALNIIESILNKKYKNIKLTMHNLYEKELYGFSLYYGTKGEKIKYSEAYAGSGEIAIVKLIHDLINVKDCSLVLLDEPETSLHPLAQKRLINFILEQIKRKKLQVVISTHSPDIIEGMPKEAIKIFYVNQETGKTNVIENVYPENAFTHIGRSVTDKKVIIVEDVLAKMIVEKVIEKKGDSALLEVKFFPGGVSQIKQNEMVVYSKEENSRYFVIFDGDQSAEKIDIMSLTVREKTPEQLKEKIRNLVGEEIKFAFDSNATDEQKVDLMLNYIKYHHDNVFFLPKNIPEKIIWSNDILEKADLSKIEKERIKNEDDYKKKFNLFALYNFGGNTAEYQIKAYEYFLTRWLKEENKDYHNITDIINEIKSR